VSTRLLGTLNGMVGVAWSDVAVGGILVAAVASFVAAIVLTTTRTRHVDDEDLELPLAG